MQIGDKVFLKPINNAARGGNKEIKEYMIKKIGRKYFEVWDGIYEFTTVKFYIGSNQQVTDYSSDWVIYFSKQEILDEYEFNQLTSDIREVFNIYGKVNLALEQLREIKRIIDFH